MIRIGNLVPQQALVCRFGLKEPPFIKPKANLFQHSLEIRPALDEAAKTDQPSRVRDNPYCDRREVMLAHSR